MQDLEKLSKYPDVEMKDDEEEKIDPFSQTNVGIVKVRSFSLKDEEMI